MELGEREDCLLFDFTKYREAITQRLAMQHYKKVLSVEESP